MQLQSQRIDNVFDSVQQIDRDSADNTKLLHELLVNMENLGESVKYLKSELAANWGTEDVVMETDEDRQYKEMQETLLAEVSSSFPCSEVFVNPTATTPMPMSVPIATPILSAASSSSLPSDADQRMKMKLDELRQPATEEKLEKEEKHVSFNFDTPASATLPYPGLDGHPRRITPIPISPASSVAPVQTAKSPEQIKQETDDLIQRLRREKEEQEALAKEIEKRNVFTMDAAEFAGFNVNEKSVKSQKTSERSAGGARLDDEQSPSGQATSQYSGTHRSTIGDTTVATAEAAMIRREVRGALQQAVPGIQFSTG